MTQWHEGPPPSIGWWPASTVRNSDAIRWWDGREWSCAAYQHYSAKDAGAKAKLTSFDQDKIEWLKCWWEKKK